jgi:hypothetical protein
VRWCAFNASIAIKWTTSERALWTQMRWTILMSIHLQGSSLRSTTATNNRKRSMTKWWILKATARLRCSCYRIVSQFYPKEVWSQRMNLIAQTQSARTDGSTTHRLLRSCLEHFSTSTLHRILRGTNQNLHAKHARNPTIQQATRMVRVTRKPW